jgi:hypothetical protein
MLEGKDDRSGGIIIDKCRPCPPEWRTGRMAIGTKSVRPCIEFERQATASTAGWHDELQISPAIDAETVRSPDDHAAGGTSRRQCDIQPAPDQRQDAVEPLFAPDSLTRTIHPYFSALAGTGLYADIAGSEGY